METDGSTGWLALMWKFDLTFFFSLLACLHDGVIVEVLCFSCPCLCLCFAVDSCVHALDWLGFGGLVGAWVFFGFYES